MSGPDPDSGRASLIWLDDFVRQEIRRIDQSDKLILSSVTETVYVGEASPHRHRKAQLMYVIDGLLTVETPQGLWTVPPRCALWIPSNVLHAARMTGPLKIASIYIEPQPAFPLSASCGILFVEPLLRELIVRYAAWSVGDADRKSNILTVLLDELFSAPMEPIHLPMPADRRLRRLTEALIMNPASRFTIDEWGARVGASNRTLSRLFQRETGLSFGRWRQQLHVGLALQRLAGGDPVNIIANDLGYESASAFIAMFRRIMGTTPARYFGDATAAGEQPAPRIGTVVPIRGPTSAS